MHEKYKNLKGEIRVLYRAADTLTLWGIPYEMREGQAPRDLWNGRAIPAPPWASTLAGATLASPGPREDWVYLGEPGWWGNRDIEAKEAARAFLEPLLAQGLIPGGPHEWQVLPQA